MLRQRGEYIRSLPLIDTHLLIRYATGQKRPSRKTKSINRGRAVLCPEQRQRNNRNAVLSPVGVFTCSQDYEICYLILELFLQPQ